MGRIKAKDIEAVASIKFDNGFQPLNLDPLEVSNIFGDCFASKNEDKNNIIYSKLFLEETGFDKDGTAVPFNYQKLKTHEKEIRFLLGQLNEIHNGHFFINLKDMFQKYDGTSWVKGNALLYLNHLACALGLTSNFEKENDTTLVSLSDKIAPTLSLSDPNFPAWWEEHKAEWEG